MKRWVCMDCENEVELDRHGRCEHCDSEAVDLVESTGDLTLYFSMIKAATSSYQAAA